jgi:Cu/Ag efflux pump CusA
MVGSTLLAVTLVPVLCSSAGARAVSREDRNIIMRVLLKIYDPVLNWALKHRKTVISAAALLLATALLGVRSAAGVDGEDSRCGLDRARRVWCKASARNSCRR